MYLPMNIIRLNVYQFELAVTVAYASIMSCTSSSTCVRVTCTLVGPTGFACGSHPDFQFGVRLIPPSHRHVFGRAKPFLGALLKMYHLAGGLIFV